MSKIDYSKWDKIDYEADEDIVALPPVAPINVTPQAAESAGPFKQLKDPNRYGADGCTPFHKAILANDFSLVKQLLQAGASVNLRVRGGHVNAGYSALHLAVEAAHKCDTLALLTAIVTAPNVQIDSTVDDATRRTCLHIVGLSGDVAAAELLRAQGAQFDVLDAQRHTPLDLAANAERVDMVQYLLDRLATSSAGLRDKVFRNQDSSGDSAFHHAVKAQNQRLFNYNYPLRDAQYNISYMLARAGLDANLSNVDGDSAVDLMPEPLAQLVDAISNPSVRSRILSPKLAQLPAFMALASEAEGKGLIALGVDSANALMLAAVCTSITSFQANEEAKEARMGGCPVMNRRVGTPLLRRFVKRDPNLLSALSAPMESVAGSSIVSSSGVTAPAGAGCPFLSAKAAGKVTDPTAMMSMMGPSTAVPAGHPPIPQSMVAGATAASKPSGSAALHGLATQSEPTSAGFSSAAPALTVPANRPLSSQGIAAGSSGGGAGGLPDDILKLLERDLSSGFMTPPLAQGGHDHGAPSASRAFADPAVGSVAKSAASSPPPSSSAPVQQKVVERDLEEDSSGDNEDHSGGAAAAAARDDSHIANHDRPTTTTPRGAHVPAGDARTRLKQPRNSALHAWMDSVLTDLASSVKRPSFVVYVLVLILAVIIARYV